MQIDKVHEKMYNAVTRSRKTRPTATEKAESTQKLKAIYM